ncbi:DNA-binding protein [Polynucleobacter wuianus]|uniref:DNA-binding protein n=1 Tax=Polynucleobacter wuianus TaxID=1743168 RepID=A0A191UGG2_9BURK|nr:MULTISPECIES: WYL domain-containing protein [Polynucleobacter]ANJ00007.1 DNA-binding protein [Polynucleobacter wuianus]MBU3552839.1 WYL domain-containing protein [Polynucleobacter sp. MWH-Post4-6-1]
MSDMERLHRIKYMIQQRKCVPREDFLSELEISPATFKRDLEYLRSRMQASIVYDRFLGGYKFENSSSIERIEMPGLWFSEKEATALVLMQHLLSSLDQGGLIGPHIEPLTAIIDGILGQSDATAKELRKRIKVIGMGSRKNSIENFSEIGAALLKRNRLQITYYSKSKDENTVREISPQRLIYYRENWYLDANCHLRNDLRSFSVDGIQSAVLTNKKAQEVSEKECQEHFAQSYGIFSGKATQRAKLRFTPEHARWVSGEHWHGQQVGNFDKDGYYNLEFDYNQDPELVMDILKHGSGVEVISPASLKNKVKAELKKAIELY